MEELERYQANGRCLPDQKRTADTKTQQRNQTCHDDHCRYLVSDCAPAEQDRGSQDGTDGRCIDALDEALHERFGAMAHEWRSREQNQQERRQEMAMVQITAPKGPATK